MKERDLRAPPNPGNLGDSGGSPTAIGRTFVVGYMHSGTTLLLNVLRNNSALFSTGRETKFFDRLPTIRRNYPDLDDDRALQEFVSFVVGIVHNGYRLENPSAPLDAAALLSEGGLDLVLSEARRTKDYTETFRAVWDQSARAVEKLHWVEKTPAHVFHVDEIVRCIPDARIVIVVRDPRDILASKKTRREAIWTDKYRANERPLKKRLKAYDPLWDTLSWKSAIRIGRMAQRDHPGRVLTVTYEEFVGEPETLVRRLCDFLRLEFEPAMLEISSRNAAGERPRTSKTTHRGIKKDAVGRWSRVLSPAEIVLCQWLAKNEMDHFGYSSIPVPLRSKARVVLIVAKSGARFTQRIYERWRLGGMPYLQNVVRNYIGRLRSLTTSR
jgi:omega-hydroxy-beta-dihydromenaquinone-9 sulfotransferase